MASVLAGVPGSLLTNNTPQILLRDLKVLPEQQEIAVTSSEVWAYPKPCIYPRANIHSSTMTLFLWHSSFLRCVVSLISRFFQSISGSSVYPGNSPFFSTKSLICIFFFFCESFLSIPLHQTPSGPLSPPSLLPMVHCNMNSGTP